MNQLVLYNKTSHGIRAVLDRFEAAQAEAADLVRQIGALGGESYMAGFDWESVDASAADFADAYAALQVVSTILDPPNATATALYKVAP